MKIMFSVAISVWLLGAGLAGAQVSHVVPPGTDGVTPDYPYNSWTNAATNIQTAVNAAAAQGWTNVWITNGEYRLTGEVLIEDAMTVRSWHEGAIDRAGTIVDGNYPNTTNRCFRLDHAQAVLRGITISNGYSVSGGGVYLNGSAVLDDCLVIGNQSSSYAGGVYVNQGTVTGCVVVANVSTSYGGGIHLLNNSLVIDTVVSNNQSVQGGGIMIVSGTAAHCVVEGNLGTSMGGGIRASGANSAIVATEILRNRTTVFGGGVALENKAVARDCLIAGNTNTYDHRSSNRGGGGVYMTNAVVEDCIISNNNAYGVGGGVAMLNNGGIVRRSTICCNRAGEGFYAGNDYYQGAGVFYYGSGTVENCRITGNTSVYSSGAGVVIWDQDGAVLRNCLVADNFAPTNAAGIYVYRGTTTIENCTITANRVDPGRSGDAGGVYLSCAVSNMTTIRNCIIYGNTNAAGYSNMYWTTSGDRVVENSCIAPVPNHFTFITVTNTFANDPQLDEAGRLAGDSPCVNAGLYQAWMDEALDLDGRPRLDRFAGLVDIGGYEYVGMGAMFRIR